MANNPINARLDIFKSFLKTDAEKAFVTLFNDHAGDWNKIADSLSESMERNSYSNSSKSRNSLIFNKLTFGKPN